MCDSGQKYDEPRLSAAIIMPSLYLIARTDVPVTMGCLRYGETWNGKVWRAHGHNDILCVFYCTVGC